MTTPILDLTIQYLKHSNNFPDNHWGSNNIKVEVQDNIAEIMADFIIRIKTLFGVNDVNTLDIRIF